MSNPIRQLYELGQSVWCDSISRAMIDSGELQRLIDLGVVGVTSNPTIFMKAITSSADYDDRLADLTRTDHDPLEVYEGLVLPDIADAADILRPVYERSDGVDGYISLEVNPRLAYDTEATIAEGRRLFAQLDRPNIFIKVPATSEGIPAIEALIAGSVNVNVTLIFGLAAYEQVMNAYLAGLNRLERAGGDVARVASVASFFVSRVDTLVDGQLEVMQTSGVLVDHLLGQAAVANAKLAYARFLEVFDRLSAFGLLAEKGARVQRPLWASTSTKNPNYGDTMYVDNLVGPHTVNTMPPDTISATLDHGVAEVTLGDDLDVARALFTDLAEQGIDMQAVSDKLLADGVAAFSKSFDELLAGIALKTSRLRPVG